MKAKVHVAAIVLFALAGLCYAATWIQAAAGLGFLGIALEVLAWIFLIDRDRDLSRDTEENQS